MTINEFYKRLRENGDRLNPTFEQALLRHTIDRSDEKVVDLRAISPEHAKASGPLLNGNVTAENAHNVLHFPSKLALQRTATGKAS